MGNRDFHWIQGLWKSSYWDYPAPGDIVDHCGRQGLLNTPKLFPTLFFLFHLSHAFPGLYPRQAPSAHHSHLQTKAGRLLRVITDLSSCFILSALYSDKMVVRTSTTIWQLSDKDQQIPWPYSFLEPCLTISGLLIKWEK